MHGVGGRRLYDKKRGQYTTLNNMNSKGNRPNKILSISFCLRTSLFTVSLNLISDVHGFVDLFEDETEDAGEVLYLCRNRIPP
jgi:hypothetical protein